MRVNNPDRSPVPPTIRAALAKRVTAQRQRERGQRHLGAQGTPHLSGIARLARFALAREGNDMMVV